MFSKDRLRTLRVAKGLSQRELADLAGLGMMTVHNAEVGRGRPNDTTQEKIAKALGVSTGSLHDGAQPLIVQISV